ncbi:hypothetical protein [Halomarina pelagica]|uniref:hypothetical protein n=1 Tax=Halomarina pelagica TaxID=2961599 RepID=UPI0020C41353|nr:hypothetical protein [Halomarina sp. BND7]
MGPLRFLHPLQTLGGAVTLGYFALVFVTAVGLLVFWLLRVRERATPGDPDNTFAWILGGLALALVGGVSAALVGLALYARIERDVPYQYALVVAALAFALFWLGSTPFLLSVGI